MKQDRAFTTRPANGHSSESVGGRVRRFTRSPGCLIDTTRRSKASWLSGAGYAQPSGTDRDRH